MPGHVFKYNPLEMRIEDLERLFVGRKALLDEIADRLESSSQGRSTNHFIIIGPRGMGKTAMLRMIEREMKQREIPNLYSIQFSEETPGIASLHRFFIHALDLLARKYNKSLEGEIDGIRRDFGDRLGKKAFGMLKKYLEERNSKVLLLIDNIDYLLQEQLSGKRSLATLRNILMNEHRIMVVGTAHSSFREIEDYEATFYSLFDVKFLDYLKPDEILRVLKNRASLDRDERAIDRIENQNVNIRAITELTGGSPRLILILYELIVDVSVNNVITTFNKLLDDHTGFYRERLKELTSRKKEIINAIMELGGSAAPSEISEHIGLKTNQVTAVVSKMVKNRVLIHQEPKVKSLGDKCHLQPGSRKWKRKGRSLTRYTTADGIFRMWYSMRYLRKYRGKNLYLVEFLSTWYATGDNIRKRADKCIKLKDKLSAEERALSLSYYGEAYSIIEDRDSFYYQIETEAVKNYFDAKKYEEIINEVDRALGEDRGRDLSEAEADLLMYKVRSMREIRKSDEALVDLEEILDSDASPAKKAEVMNEMASIHISREDYNKGLEVLNRAMEKSLTENLTGEEKKEIARSMRLKGVVFVEQGRSRDGMKLYDDVIDQFGGTQPNGIKVEVVKTIFNKGVAQLLTEKYKDVVETYDELVERFGESKERDIQIQVAKAMFNKGVAQRLTEKYKDVVETYDELVERFGDAESPQIVSLVATGLVSSGWHIAESKEFGEALEKTKLGISHAKKRVDDPGFFIWSYLNRTEIEALMGKRASSIRSLEKAIDYARDAPAEKSKEMFVASIKELLVLGECDLALKMADKASEALDEEVAGVLEPLVHASRYFVSGDKQDLEGLSPEMDTAIARIVKDVMEEMKEKKDG